MTNKEVDILEKEAQKTDKMLSLIEELVAIRKEDYVYRDKHSEEHRFLRTLIEKEQAKKVFWTSVANKVISGGIWSLVVALSGAILFTIREALKIS